VIGIFLDGNWLVVGGNTVGTGTLYRVFQEE